MQEGEHNRKEKKGQRGNGAKREKKGGGKGAQKGAWRPLTRIGRCQRPQETAPVQRAKEGPYRKPDASVTGSTHAKQRQRMQSKREAGRTHQGQHHRVARTGTTRSAPS